MPDLIEDADGAPYPPLIQTLIQRAAEDPDGPALLLIGDAPVPLAGGGQYLVTVWQDGSATYAWRPVSTATWGPPEPLRPAP